MDEFIQADEYERDFDAEDAYWDSYFAADERYGDDDGEPREYEPDDDFPMYLEYEGAFGLSGYDEY